PIGLLRRGVRCERASSASRRCVTIGSSFRRCRPTSAARPIRSANSAWQPIRAAPIRRVSPATGSNFIPVSARRRRGDASFITEADPNDIDRTLQTLMQQKSRQFAHRGVGDMFARPGWRDFFLDVAVNPATRPLVHVSRVQIGEGCAAANLGLVFGGTYYHMVASYDDGEVSRYGPGALHLRELLA